MNNSGEWPGSLRVKEEPGTYKQYVLIENDPEMLKPDYFKILSNMRFEWTKSIIMEHLVKDLSLLNCEIATVQTPLILLTNSDKGRLFDSRLFHQLMKIEDFSMFTKKMS